MMIKQTLMKRLSNKEMQALFHGKIFARFRINDSEKLSE